MKFLKYTAIILTSIVALFLLIGLMKPTVQYDCTITIEKPIEESWQVMQDPSKMSEWMDGFKRMEHISGERGGVGSVSHVIFGDEESEVIIKETITRIIPNHSIEMTLENEMMNMDYVLEMQRSGNGTKIKTHTIIKGAGVFVKSFIAISPSIFKNQEDTNLSMLKKTVEANTDTYKSNEELMMEK